MKVSPLRTSKPGHIICPACGSGELVPQGSHLTVCDSCGLSTNGAERIDRAFHRGEVLPPVSLYKVGGFYFVLDGHHCVSVACYHGVKWIDAYVTEFGAAGLQSNRKNKEGLKEASQRGEAMIQEMMDIQLVNQRREEMLREAELNHQAKALQAAGKGRASRRSTLVWEMMRHAGRLLKLLGRRRPLS